VHAIVPAYLEIVRLIKCKYISLQYEKFVLDADGSITKVHFVVEGRKCPLQEIREKTLKESAKYMRKNENEYFEEMSSEDVMKKLLTANEVKEGEDMANLKQHLMEIERTRHLLVWHDLSTVANHSHLVFMVSCLYDPAIYYTDEEYEQMTGKKINIQAKIETPRST
jgi:hypothetical protein